MKTELYEAKIITTITTLMLIFLPLSMVANYLNARESFAVLYLFIFLATLQHLYCFKKQKDINAASEQILLILFGLFFAFFLIGEQSSFDVLWILVLPIVAVMTASLERLKTWLLRTIFLLLFMIGGAYFFPDTIEYEPFALFSLLWALLFLSYLAYSYKDIQLRLQMKINSYQRSLEEKIQEGLKEITLLNKNLDETQSEILERVALLGEYRCKERVKHSKTIGLFAKKLALLAGVDEKSAEILERAAPLHDIGNIGLEDTILNKPGRLTALEYEEMKQHVFIGKKILEGSDKALLQRAAEIAYTHHEKYDGSGYPLGLQGENIPLSGRIVAIVDVFDALYSERSYKKNWSNEDIINHYTKEKGKHFDPHLTELFLQNIELFINIYEEAYLESNIQGSRVR